MHENEFGSLIVGSAVHLHLMTADKQADTIRSALRNSESLRGFVPL